MIIIIIIKIITILFIFTIFTKFTITNFSDQRNNSLVKRQNEASARIVL